MERRWLTNSCVGVRIGNSPTLYWALNMVLRDIDKFGSLECGMLKGTCYMAVHL